METARPLCRAAEVFKENVNIREYTVAQFIFEMTTYVHIFYYMYPYLHVEFQSTITIASKKEQQVCVWEVNLCEFIVILIIV